MPSFVRGSFRALALKLLAERRHPKLAGLSRSRASTASSILTPSFWRGLTSIPQPEYTGIRTGQAPSEACFDLDVVIITARFRTGSTMLWNLFRNTEGCTAYYEPLSPSRYFDPTNRVERVCPTHLGVEEYWREYQGSGRVVATLPNRVALQESCHGSGFLGSGYECFFEVMIEKAEGRPILQFNRIDFRLPWVRRHFPTRASDPFVSSSA